MNPMSVRVIIWLTLSLPLVAFGLLVIGCTQARWPITQVNLNGVIITQNIKDAKVLLKIGVPDKGNNSAIWPLARLEEIGDGVIIINFIRGGSGSLLGSTSGGEEIVVNREVGKNYVLLVRDENGVLNNIKDFTIK